MHFAPNFYRGAAIASVLSALTTLGLIFLPKFYPPIADFEARMALGDNPAYILRSWIYLFHPFLVFTAAFATFTRCTARAAGAASLGLAGFALWASTEAAQQAMTKVLLDRTWRAAWPAADEAARELIRNHFTFYDLTWDAMYLLILIAFFLGNLFLGAAVARTARSQGTPRDTLGLWVAIALWAGAAMTALLLVPEFGGPTIGGFAWLYPLIQPAGRALIGVWLWRQASSVKAV
jgi:hypothetical protein